MRLLLAFLSATLMVAAQDDMGVARGNQYLDHGLIDAARAACDAALRANPSNSAAGTCLDRAALDEADKLLANHKLLDAEGLALPISKASSPDNSQKQRAIAILATIRWQKLADRVIPNWLLDFGVALVILGVAAMALFAVRWLWRRCRRINPAALQRRITWAVLPVKEDPKDNLEATGVILDALSRLPRELRQDLWQPRLLLLKPTPPASYEPEIIDEFLRSTLPSVVMIAAARDLDLRCDLHDWQFDEAVQGLELKIQSINLGSVARFIRSIGRWFNAGSPRLTGVAEIMPDKSVVVRLLASGGPSGFVAVAAATEGDSGVDGMRLSAERAVFKLLYRLRFPDHTQAAVDGQAALRQAVALFGQYAGTSAGAAADVNARTAALAQAGRSFGNARACLTAMASDQLDVRPAVLLAEGVAYALLNQHASALERFRQLEDWPSLDGVDVLRNQARYNAAVILNRLGKPGAAVLELTSLLGERPSDLGLENRVAEVERQGKADLGLALRYFARLARAAALAEYDVEAWLQLSRQRAEMVIDDAKSLLQDLEGLRPCAQAHDERIAGYLYTETLRARGRILLNFVKTRYCADLYVDGRPTGLKRIQQGDQWVPTGTVSQEARVFLTEAMGHMQRCVEQTVGLFCDLAEAELLVGDYAVGEQYARQATLVAPECERGYYLAAEICYLSGIAEQLERAKKYVGAYHGSQSVSGPFISLMADLGLASPLATRVRGQAA